MFRFKKLSKKELDELCKKIKKENSDHPSMFFEEEKITKPKENKMKVFEHEKVSKKDFLEKIEAVRLGHDLNRRHDSLFLLDILKLMTKDIPQTEIPQTSLALFEHFLGVPQWVMGFQLFLLRKVGDFRNITLSLEFVKALNEGSDLNTIASPFLKFLASSLESLDTPEAKDLSKILIKKSIQYENFNILTRDAQHEFGVETYATVVFRRLIEDTGSWAVVEIQIDSFWDCVANRFFSLIRDCESGEL